MTREEAIEVVRKNLPHLGIGATEMTDALGTLIPELAESEDERIIKTLQEYVKNRNWNLGGPTQDEVLTWLKKKKEQKQEWSEEEFNKTISLVYKAIRKALASLAVYAEDEALLDSKEETLSYYSQRCAEKIFKFLRPSWKPSEEQMIALEAATVRYQSTGLESLYEDLKKRM